MRILKKERKNVGYLINVKFCRKVYLFRFVKGESYEDDSVDFSFGGFSLIYCFLIII